MAQDTGRQNLPIERRRWRGRTALMLAGIVVALLILAIGGTLAFYYKATKPDRSTPIVVADSFLEAAFVAGDANRLSLFVCRGWPSDQAIKNARSAVDPTARVSWDTFTVTSQSDSDAELRVRMRFQFPGELAPSGEDMWTFRLQKEDGWRVCDIEFGARQN